MTNALSISAANFDDWAARSAYWQSTAKTNSRRSRSARETKPLILTGNGVSIALDRGTLLIRNGLTHFPQEREIFRFFKGDPELPSRIVMLDGSGRLTFDVISWLSDQAVPLVQIDYTGRVISVIGGSGFTSDPEKVRWQIETRNDPERRLAFCCDLIAAKLTASVRTLKEVVPDTATRAIAIARAEGGIQALRNTVLKSVDDVRMLEARAAAAYFSAWKGIPLNWRSRWKHPVPDAWLTIGPRGSSGRAKMPTNRSARHPFNAMLNYAYSTLYSRVHIDTVSDGFDPRRGIMHQDRDDSDALAWVFDMIEPRRALVDLALLKFVRETEFTGADFVLNSLGVVRLAPHLAASVCRRAQEVRTT